MHNIEHRVYPEDVDRKKVKNDIDKFVAMEDYQEGCRGLYHDIRWLDSHEVMASYDEAAEEIERLDRGDYDNLAIRFRKVDVNAKPEYLKAAAQKKSDIYRANAELREKLTDELIGAKSAYIGCKACGSKINRKYLGNAYCPVCRKTLLSETAQKRLKAADERVKKAEKAFVEAEKKAAKNGKVYWLLKFEYHT